MKSMRQQSLSDNRVEKCRKKQFLDEMESIISWQELTEAIEPYCPKHKVPVVVLFASNG
jgi:hypothetical protein